MSTSVNPSKSFMFVGFETNLPPFACVHFSWNHHLHFKNHQNGIWRPLSPGLENPPRNTWPLLWRSSPPRRISTWQCNSAMANFGQIQSGFRLKKSTLEPSNESPKKRHHCWHKNVEAKTKNTSPRWSWYFELTSFHSPWLWWRVHYGSQILHGCVLLGWPSKTAGQTSYILRQSKLLFMIEVTLARTGTVFHYQNTCETLPGLRGFVKVIALL